MNAIDPPTNTNKSVMDDSNDFDKLRTISPARGILIKQTLIAKKMSISAFAEMCKVSRTTVTNWTNGRPINPDNAQSIVELLGLPLERLLNAEEVQAEDENKLPLLDRELFFGGTVITNYVGVPREIKDIADGAVGVQNSEFYPMINKGDLVYYNASKKIRTGYYVFFAYGEIVIKRIERHFDGSIDIIHNQDGDKIDSVDKEEDLTRTVYSTLEDVDSEHLAERYINFQFIGKVVAITRRL